MAKRKRAKVKPELTPTFAVEGKVWNDRGERVRPGNVVRVPRLKSETWGMVPERVGMVVRLFTRGESPEILADIRGPGGLYTVRVKNCNRSRTDLDETGERKARRQGINFENLKGGK